VQFENLRSSTRSGLATGLPIGKIIFADAFAVAAKDAANESEVILTCTLPTGYFYRPSQLWMSASGTTAATFHQASGFEVGARALFTENQVEAYSFALMNLVSDGFEIFGGTNIGAFKSAPDAVTNDFSTFFKPYQDISSLWIDASVGASIFRCTWMDTSSDATTAIAITWRLEVMRFTVEQARYAYANSPTLIY